MTAWIHSVGTLACILIMGLIVALGPYHTPDMFLPDQGALWYYWKLAEPDFWSRFSGWSLYALHQLGLWGLIAWAQSRRLSYTRALHPVNIIAISFNLLFVMLHIWQTRVFYDGLAQDVSIFTSFGSVAILLMLVVMVGGLVSIQTITKEVFPTFPSRFLTITVPYPGSSPEEVEDNCLLTEEQILADGDESALGY